MTKEERDAAFEKHRMEQVRSIARGTTPQQRIEWLNEMLELFGPAILRERERRERAGLKPDPRD